MEHNLEKEMKKCVKNDDKNLWDLWMSVFHMPIITVADEIGFFDLLGSNVLSFQKIAEGLSLSTRSVEVLVNPLISLGFAHKDKEMVGLSPSAEKYFLSKSAFYWGSQLHPFREGIEHKRILEAINNSKPQLEFDEKSFTQMWEEGSITDNAANDFTQKMQATHNAAAQHLVKSGLFSSINRLLDVGAGSGCFSAAFVNQYPNSKAILFDLPPVSKTSAKYLSNFPYKQKLELYEGNFLKDVWPKGCDGILLSQILHDWSYEICGKILHSAYDSLEVNGRIFIHEMLLDEEKISPTSTVFFDALMFVNHQSQQFTQSEIFKLLTDCGFKQPTVQKMFGYFSLITALK